MIAMENPGAGSRRWNRGGFEENILAIFDASETKDSQESRDDRIAFLNAVRAVSVVSDHGTSPTSKMFEGVFHILRTGKSLELIMASYQLLIELNKRFPRVYFSREDKSKSVSHSSSELVVVEEAWSPIIVSVDNASTVNQAAGRESGGPIDPFSFYCLIDELAEMLSNTKFQASDVKLLQNMLLFQYLIKVFEGDFLPRKATMDWNIERESLLNMLLGSRKINYKALMKICLTVIYQLSQLKNELNKYMEREEVTESCLSKNCGTALSIAMVEVGNNTCVSMEKFIVMIMELDMSRNKADLAGYTTRADGSRTPLVDIILDELTYSQDIVPQFLQIFAEPKWKLEIVVQYLWKYITKPSVRTRRKNGSAEDETFSGALKFFSNKATTKSTIKKIDSDIVQFLLAHGFQAQLSVLSEGHAEDKIAGHEEERLSALVDMCQSFISAFDCLRSTDEHMEVLSVGKEALFTAATIISMKS
ncbi:negative regulator of systemic acquired resistance SNI1 isoform X2 [Prosopis cineraria]|uniref:negative regulator of systemic acquired resistance SNI1 isoform X2 n=1 Tax=Prosopis cineraria TaxID=364024 RepID=UPI00240EE484|nr:negative regulator of systemic acquired resistance SNI1 isoform X2 [Prosopis cineraria]